MSSKRYTDAQKIAYYKKLAQGKARVVTGRGAYKSKKAGGGGKVYYKKYKAAKAAAASSNGGGWLAPALGAIGSAILPGIGGPLGQGVGSLIKSVTGFGDYQVKENSLFVPEAGDPPRVENSSGGKSVVIRHREYLNDVISSATPGAFKLDNYYLNPGDRKTFPWLSQIADSFEHYRIRGMLFEFRTMSADALNSTNTALGQVIMSTQYNAALPNFNNKYEMENYEFGCSTKPSSSLIHPIECAKSQSVLGDLYVRPTIGVPTGEDRRLYDFGNFMIATNGLQAASVNVGELWMTYEIELFKPKVITEDGLYIPWAESYAQAATVGTVSQANPFGTVTDGMCGAALDTESTIACNNTSTTVTFHDLPVADYEMYITWYGAAAAYAITPSSIVWTASSGVTIIDQTGAPTAYNTMANAITMKIHFRVLTAGNDVVLTPTCSASPPSGGVLRWEVMQVPKHN